jgi:hypothetical protein
MDENTQTTGAASPAPDETTAPAAAPPAAPAGVVPPARSAELTPAELWDQGVEEGRERLDEVARSATQRDWLIITKKLDRSRQEIGADSGLTMLALAWVKLKAEHGGASWDKLLDMTDAELEAIHGFPPGSRPEE